MPYILRSPFAKSPLNGMMSKKRTLDSFFKSTSTTSPSNKKPRQDLTPETNIASSTDGTTSSLVTNEAKSYTTHKTYPFPIPTLPSALSNEIQFSPAAEPSVINNERDLDLLYFAPFLSKQNASDYFHFLRSELPFYRVKYTIKRGGVETLINTPRYTTVFGVDESSFFTQLGANGDGGEWQLLDRGSKRPIPNDRYKSSPRPIPACLDTLRKLAEGSTGETYNFCLVNYYANGNDSISYHSDDEAFLAKEPAIASFSLGAKRDFLMRHKSVAKKEALVGQPPKDQKFALNSGDMVLMRGATQKNWLHSIPKRKGAEAERGRINITFRKAMVRGGTENYYRYNVGGGEVYRWDEGAGEMRIWDGTSGNA